VCGVVCCIEPDSEEVSEGEGITIQSNCNSGMYVFVFLFSTYFAPILFI
jgi:hypothetical protein